MLFVNCFAMHFLQVLIDRRNAIYVQYQMI